MSSDNVIFSNRLRKQLDLLGISAAEAARRAGEKSSERLKQVMAGNQRCPIDLLAALSEIGVNVQYVVTGSTGLTAEQERAGYVVQVLSPAEAAALEALRGSGALHQSAVITGDKNSVNQSQGGAHGKPGRKARSQDRG